MGEIWGGIERAAVLRLGRVRVRVRVRNRVRVRVRLRVRASHLVDADRAVHRGDDEQPAQLVRVRVRVRVGVKVGVGVGVRVGVRPSLP